MNYKIACLTSSNIFNECAYIYTHTYLINIVNESLNTFTSQMKSGRTLN